MAKVEIKIDRYTCNGCGKEVDGDVDGQAAPGYHGETTFVDDTGEGARKFEWFACRLSHVKSAIDAAQADLDAQVA